MILLLVTLILLTLKWVGVLEWSYWIVCMPIILEAIFSLYLFIKAEVEYLRSIKKTKEEVKE